MRSPGASIQCWFLTPRTAHPSTGCGRTASVSRPSCWLHGGGIRPRPFDLLFACMSQQNSLHDFITNPWVGFAFGIVVLVLGWKMTATWANWLLVLAWAIFAISVFRAPLINGQALMPRFLWTVLIASAIGLVLHRTLWSEELTTVGEADRAWVTLSTAHLVNLPALGVNPMVRVVVLNTGRTPALDVEIGGNVFSRNSSAPLELAGPFEGERKSKVTLGAGVPYTVFLDSTEPFTKQTQVDAVLTGQNALYATGSVIYKDIGGGERRTDFCLKTGGEDLQKRDDTGYVVLAACSAGNTTK